MTQESIDVTIREAIPSDAAKLLEIMKQIGKETPYLVIDEAGLKLSAEEMSHYLAQIYESKNNVFLVALVDGKMVGSIRVKGEPEKRIEHIGEIGISILKDYWGFGLGTRLIEEAICWARESKVIRRLELTVQDRNQRAIHVYRKIGFVTEAVMERGAKTDDGEFLDVHLMRLLID